MSKPIFVIGNGRSGTHWLGYQLDEHPEIETTIEDKKIFFLVTEMALNFSNQKKLYPKLVKIYRRRIKKTKEKYYADKSHPNIWFVEKLSADFPDSKFIGIVRSPYSTIASMMNHRGVMAWHYRWKEFDIPNTFLGITKDMAEKYDIMSIPEKCFLRWLSHYRRMQELKNNNNLLVISYEDFALKQDEILKQIQQFLGLATAFKPMEVKKESLTKWKMTLNQQDRTNITEMLKVNGINEYDDSI